METHGATKRPYHRKRRDRLFQQLNSTATSWAHSPVTVNTSSVNGAVSACPTLPRPLHMQSIHTPPDHYTCSQFTFAISVHRGSWLRRSTSPWRCLGEQG